MKAGLASNYKPNGPQSGSSEKLHSSKYRRAKKEVAWRKDPKKETKSAGSPAAESGKNSSDSTRLVVLQSVGLVDSA